MKEFKKSLILFALLVFTALSLANCRETRKSDDGEDAIEEVEDGLEEAGEEVEDAAEDVEEEVDGDTDDH